MDSELPQQTANNSKKTLDEFFNAIMHLNNYNVIQMSIMSWVSQYIYRL